MYIWTFDDKLNIVKLSLLYLNVTGFKMLQDLKWTRQLTIRAIRYKHTYTNIEQLRLKEVRQDAPVDSFTRSSVETRNNTL